MPAGATLTRGPGVAAQPPAIAAIAAVSAVATAVVADPPGPAGGARSTGTEQPGATTAAAGAAVAGEVRSNGSVSARATLPTASGVARQPAAGPTAATIAAVTGGVALAAAGGPADATLPAGA
ncbi:hypothetical protein B1T43_21700, partial [Mycobacterium kansasii]